MTASSVDPGIVTLAADFPPASPDQWRALVEKAIKGADFEKRMVSRTADGLRIAPLFTRAGANVEADRALPGEAPYTRGTRERREGPGWDIRQFYTGSDAKAVNAAILDDLQGGATSIALHIGTPYRSRPALDGDGLAVALDGVLLDLCPVSLIAGEHTPEAAAALNAVWCQRGVDEAKRLGHYGADPLGLMAMSGGLSQPLDSALAAAAGLAVTAQPMPGVTALLADGHAYHCGGASEGQELAAMLATFVAYLRECEAAGLSPEQSVPKIAVSLAADADQFMTIAKLRAARQLIWRVADACGAGSAAGKVHITAVTAWRMMSKRDPWTNILRTTVASAGAALGGADAIVVLPFTYAIGAPDRFARRLARNIHIVLQEECNLGRVVDPAGGSWYVESLTDELAQTAWALFQEIEAQTSGTMRGMAAALQSGFVQEKIAAVAEARGKAIVTGRQELTGVSAFPLLGDDGVRCEPWDKGDHPPDTRGIAVPPLKMARLSEPFETLRDTADTQAANTGKPYRVFLASIGEVIDHTARSTWIKNYLAAGGIAALTSDGYPNADAAATAFKASGASAACICSSDALNVLHAEATAKALKVAGAKLVLMAGRPGEKEAALKAAGVDQFLFAGQDAVEVLKGLQARLA
ncbi:MAG: methylmalonyl-CoA mutase family protein [Hyphomicrobium sp.]